jgi:hypothetical protein
MPERAAGQGHAAGLGVPKGRASSKSTIIGVGLLLTVVAIGGVMVMAGQESSPVATQVAVISAPSAVAPTTAVAPVAPAQPVAPAVNIAPVAAQPPAEPAPPLNVPGQCQVGQLQQLALNLYATERREVGNVLRIHSGSYVSPPIVLTRSVQTVMFPAPPGSVDSARIIIEQQTTGGSTFDEDANGITTEHERIVDPYRDVMLLRWKTPRC